MRKTITLLLTSFFFKCLVAQNNYYVSHAGNDSDPGSFSQPFKTIQKAADVAVAGDTVFIRNGIYNQTGVDDPSRGKITFRVKNDGTKNSPITFMAYPGEKPVLDGADSLLGWQPCASAAACGNNPNWQNIYYASVPAHITAHTAILWENDSLLYVAMDPDPFDPFYWEQPGTWRIIPSFGYTDTTIVDSTYFIQSDSSFWDNAYVFIWSCNNNVLLEPISSYNSSEHKITFSSFGCPNFLDPGVDKYAMWNHISLINTPGEFYVDEQNSKIFLWPNDTANLDKISIAIRSKGVDLRGHDYITIEGLTLKRYSDAAITNYNFGSSHTADGVRILRNTVSNGKGGGIYFSGLSNSIADSNTVLNVSGNGIHFGGGKNDTISNNYVERVGATGLRFYTITNGVMLNNINRNSNGQHANGMTCYLTCDSILIEGNRIVNSNIALTFQSSSNITIKNNIFVNSLLSGGNAVAGWSGAFKGGKPYNITLYNNTIPNSLYVSTDFKNVIVKDNIIGGLGDGDSLIHSNNFFTRLTWNQTYNLANYNESVDTNKQNIFVDYYNENFSIRDTLIGLPLVNPCKMSTTGKHVGALPCVTVGTGIMSIDEPGQLLIFPNPSAGEFTLIDKNYNEGKMLEIRNSIGQLVYSAVMQSAVQKIFLPVGGLYLLSSTNKDRVVTSYRLIVE